MTGASGFLGGRIAHALQTRGYEVVRATRGARVAGRAIDVDFTRDVEPEHWLPKLDGIDVVVNAVGILREQGAQTFALLHERAPKALFAASARAGVRLVIQISALGADPEGASAYHRSKRAADDFLATLDLAAFIVQPSLVYGPGGASATLLDTLASLPVIPLPGCGEQPVQPIHVDDAIEAILAMIETAPVAPGARRVALVGPEPLSLREFLARLRRALGLPAARFVRVRMPLVRLGASLARFLPKALLDPETLAMLERGNTADASATRRWLQRVPRPVERFVAAENAGAARRDAKLRWLLPVLRWSIALVWIVTGIVSLGLYPVAEGHALLARVGLTGVLASVMLYGAAVLDIALGVGVLVLSRRHWLWLLQLTVILGYTAIITLKLPEFWLHPYGPLLKNLPMLAAIALLDALEERR